jgi:sigma-B regulation protein RsbU (phosphoserine phosphatase)
MDSIKKEGLSLKWKIIIFVWLIILSLLISYSAIFIYGEYNYLREKMVEIGQITTDAISSNLLNMIIKSNIQAIKNYIEEVYQHNKDIEFIQVFDDRKMCISSTNIEDEEKVFEDEILMRIFTRKLKGHFLIKKSFPYSCVKSKKREDILLVAKPLKFEVTEKIYGVLKIGFSYARINHEIQSTLAKIIYVTIIAILIGFVLAYLLSELLIRPLIMMMSAVKEIGQGNYDVEVKINSRDELGLLAETFNKMTAQLRSNIQQLNKQINYLRSLYRVGNVVASKIFNLNELLKEIVDSATKIISCEKCSVILLKEGKPIIKYGIGFTEKKEELVEDLQPSQGGEVTEWILKSKKPLLVDDITTDTRFSFKNSAYKTTSFIAIPLILKDEVIGLMSVTEKKDGERFSEEDVEILSIFSQQIVIAIDNAKIHQQDVERKRIEKELEIAHSIQHNMLPEKVVSIKNVELSAISIPAKEVGGDYYDFWLIDEKTVVFTIADVSGKGVPAALMMVMIRTILKTEVYAEESSAQLLKTLNALLIDDIEAAMFATIFLARFNSETGELRFTNGGHNYPILFHQNEQEPEMLDTTGFFIGMFQEPDYEEKSVKLQKGDVLLLYTDGITEAQNAKGEMFGVKRLCNFVNKNKHLRSKDIQDLLIKEVNDFIGDCEQGDDITLVVIKYE